MNGKLAVKQEENNQIPEVSIEGADVNGKLALRQEENNQIPEVSIEGTDVNGNLALKQEENNQIPKVAIAAFRISQIMRKKIFVLLPSFDIIISIIMEPYYQKQC